MRVTRLAYTVVLLPIIFSTAPAVAVPMLQPHRAVYDLSLDKASDRSGITGISGRMVYEFNGSPCDGYTVKFRFVTQISANDSTRLTDQQTTTYEDLKNRSFRFLTRSFTDEKLDKEVRGNAKDERDGVNVELTSPDTRAVELADSIFPTEHMLELIDRAKKGERFSHDDADFTVIEGDERRIHRIRAQIKRKKADVTA